MKKLLTSIFLSLTAVTVWGDDLYVGGDISMLTAYEEHGAVYRDIDGNQVEPLAFFKEQGMNAMRVRLFVNPENASEEHRKEGVIQDLDYVIKLGKSIKDAGLKFMLDFHYSDTWTDPGKHSTPKAWEGDELSNLLPLEECVYEYTKDCLEKLVDAGVTPDFIQPGNEITYGQLWPTGHIWPGGGGQDGGTWDSFTTCLKRGIAACREVCPEAKIVIHTEMSRASNVTDFYNTMAPYDVDYDIIGLSYYPDYHGTMTTLDNTLTKLENAYPDKRIMIVETGYGFRWALGGAKNEYKDQYPLTEEGQKQFTAELIATLRKHSQVNGLFWWYMEDNLYNIVFVEGKSEDWSKQFTAGYWNASLFNQETGKALPALYELKAFNDGGTAILSTRTGRQTSSEWYTLGGRRTAAKPTAKGIYIRNGEKIIIK